MTDTAGKEYLVCPLCKGDEVGFENNDSLFTHLIKLHNYVKCVNCEGNVFVNPDELDYHLETCHQNLEDDEFPQSSSPPSSPTRQKSPRQRGGLARLLEEEDEWEVTKRVRAFNEGNGGDISVLDLSEGVYSRPSKYSRDPLVGFWNAALVECLECPDRPPRTFNSINAWTQHLKPAHPNIKKVTDYRAKHRNPDITQYKHTCQICQQKFRVNISTCKKHFSLKHNLTLEEYMKRFRSVLLAEKKERPVVLPSHTLEGWWEGCMYSCRICTNTVTSPTSFEHHLALVHKIIGQKEIEEKYVAVHGKPCTLLRYHQCYICRKIVRHEYKVIYQHLVNHKLDVETYLKKFEVEVREELEWKRMDYVVERERELLASPSLDQYLDKQKTKSEPELLKDAMHEWYDGSEHECAICNEVLYSNLRFHSHIRRLHNFKNMKEYREVHGNPEKVLRHHQCQVCKSFIKWEASRIRDHLKLSHKAPHEKMTMAQYGNKYRDYILSEVSKLRGKKESSNPVIRSTIVGRDCHAQLASEEESQPGSKLSTIVSSASSTQGEFTHKQWRDLLRRRDVTRTKIACPKCNQLMNRQSLIKHMARHHQVGAQHREPARYQPIEEGGGGGGGGKNGVCGKSVITNSASKVSGQLHDISCNANSEVVTNETRKSVITVVGSSHPDEPSFGGNYLTSEIETEVEDKRKKLEEEEQQQQQQQEQDKAECDNSRRNLYASGLRSEEVDSKMGLVKAGLRISRVGPSGGRSGDGRMVVDEGGAQQSELIAKAGVEEVSVISRNTNITPGEGPRYFVDHKTGELIILDMGDHDGEKSSRGVWERLGTEENNQEDVEDLERLDGIEDLAKVGVDGKHVKEGSDCIAQEEISTEVAPADQMTVILETEADESESDSDSLYEAGPLDGKIMQIYLPEVAQLTVGSGDQSDDADREDIEILPLDKQPSDNETNVDDSPDVTVDDAFIDNEVVQYGGVDSVEEVSGVMRTVGCLGGMNGDWTSSAPPDPHHNTLSTYGEGDEDMEEMEIEQEMFEAELRSSLSGKGSKLFSFKEHEIHQPEDSGGPFEHETSEAVANHEMDIQFMTRTKDSIAKMDESTVDEFDNIEMEEADKDVEDNPVLEILESFVVTNESGVQEIAIVSKNGGTDLENHELMKHLQNLMKLGQNQMKEISPAISSLADSKTFLHNSSGETLKILEIKVESGGLKRGQEGTTREAVGEDSTPWPPEEASQEVGGGGGGSGVGGGKVSRTALYTARRTYLKKVISRRCVLGNGRVSVGTQASKWTKMGSERVKIARDKIKTGRLSSVPAKLELELDPRSDPKSVLESINKLEENIQRIKGEVLHSVVGESGGNEVEEVEPNIAETQEVGQQHRSVATQVCHEIGRGLIDEEEDQVQKAAIIHHIESGQVLEKVCPGCGRRLTTIKNLRVHLETKHGIRIAGKEGQASSASKLRDNATVQCSICSLVLSRKSINRHMRVQHRQ